MTFLVTDNVRVQYQYENTTTSTMVWSTITGYITTLSIERPHHAAGVANVRMYADALNPALNPSNDTHVRKGQKFRVQALVSGVWKSQFTGTIGKVDTSPDYTQRDGRKFPLTVVAYDSVKTRHQKTGTKGVAKTDDLRAVVTAPFKINGSTTAIAESATEELFDNDNASEWDQIQITRDSDEGFAWVDKEDQLVAYDLATMPTTNKADITEDNYTAKDLALNYTLENVINHVTIKQIEKYDNGKTHVVHKGIWKRQSSIDKYGYYKAVYTIQGTRHDAATKAGNILDANANPDIVPTGCVIPVTSTSDVAAFVDAIDLNDKVTIRLPDTTVFNVRVNTIKHEIVGSSDKKNVKWNVTFTFVNPSVRFKPTVKPSTGIANVTDGQVETAHVADTAITTAKVADGAVIMDKLDPAVQTSIQDAYDNAVDAVSDAAAAQTAATAAQTAATAAQTTANGKNKVTYSTSAPGSTANTAGDIWFVRNTTTGLITAQYEGQGGTSWASRTIDNTVIANLDAGKITTGTLGAGVSITGPLYQTTATAARGIKINSTGMTAYNSSGTPTLTIDASTGAVAMLGTLTSGSTITGATITGSTLSTAASGQRIFIDSSIIKAYSGVAGEISPAYIDPTSTTQPGLTIQSGTTTTYTERPSMWLVSGVTGNSRIVYSAGSGHYFNNTSTTVFGIQDDAIYAYQPLTVLSGGLTVSAGGADITGNSSVQGSLSVRDGITADSDGTGTGFIDNGFTMGTTTTASINTNGRIVRTSSSARYKGNIKPLEMDVARKALDLESVTYTLNEEDKNGDKQVTYPGFIAEQVDEAGAKLWVNYLEDGTTPDGVQYAQLTAAHNMLIKELYGKIESLEAEVSTLRKGD